MRIIALIISILLAVGCAIPKKIISYNEIRKDKDSLSIREGIVCRTNQIIKYKRKGKVVAEIELTAPVLVSMAEQKEKWGFFQFPTIGKSKDGTLIVGWQMNSDSHKAYGIRSGREQAPMVSKDGGRTWSPQDKTYDKYIRGYNVIMSDGSTLQVVTPQSKAIGSYKSFPKPVANESGVLYYFMDSLPEDLQGVYFNLKTTDNLIQNIHAKIIDPGLLRVAIDSLVPVVWRGNIKQLVDLSLVAAMHPARYIDRNGGGIKSGISIYKSIDRGKTWTIEGKIPFIRDGIADVIGQGEFSEPAFEILANNTFLCVVRSGSTSPMYRTFSHDLGVTWSQPEPFTPNGVKPKLLLLNNGILVMTSGRPGVQLRFSLEGDGFGWTDPIDMIPFMSDDGSYERDVSCGYSSIIEAGDDSFFLVYSDFTTKNEKGEQRKSIWCRKVSVNKHKNHFSRRRIRHTSNLHTK